MKSLAFLLTLLMMTACGPSLEDQYRAAIQASMDRRNQECGQPQHDSDCVAAAAVTRVYDTQPYNNTTRIGDRQAVFTRLEYKLATGEADTGIAYILKDDSGHWTVFAQSSARYAALPPLVNP